MLLLSRLKEAIAPAEPVVAKQASHLIALDASRIIEYSIDVIDFGFQRCPHLQIVCRGKGGEAIMQAVSHTLRLRR